MSPWVNSVPCYVHSVVPALNQLWTRSHLCPLAMYPCAFGYVSIWMWLGIHMHVLGIHLHVAVYPHGRGHVSMWSCIQINAAVYLCAEFGRRKWFCAIGEWIIWLCARGHNTEFDYALWDIMQKFGVKLKRSLRRTLTRAQNYSKFNWKYAQPL
jgi:hypothetical protein